MTKMLEISDETYEKIKEQLTADEKVEFNGFQDLVGKKFFIRTVTYHLVGKAEKIVGNIMQLSDASWVADSGRFMDAIKKGTLSEVEPVGTAFVNINAITDFFPWIHSLPTESK